jgi:predicted permease
VVFGSICSYFFWGEVMANYFVSFQQIASLLLMILLGIVGRKKGLIKPEGHKSLVNILIYFTLPALVLTSTNMPQTTGTFKTGIIAVFLGFFVRLGSLFVGEAVGRLAHWQHNQRAVFTFQMIFGNAGFIGLPVCLALYGEQGAFFGALFNLSHEFLVWTLGVWLLSQESLDDWRVLASPPGLAAVVGLILFGLNFQMPAPAAAFLKQLGAATTPVAMLLVGSQLRFRGASKRQWGLLLLLSVLRLLVVPMGLFYLLSQFALPKILVQVATVITAMPASSMITVIATQVDGDVELASASTLVTTILAVFTLPLVISIIA